MRLSRLRSHSRIDGEAVACDDNGVASFDLIRHHRHNDRAFLYAFDLIELNGDDFGELYLNRVLLDVPLLPIESETYIATVIWCPYGRGNERLVVPNKFAAGPTGEQDLDVVD